MTHHSAPPAGPGTPGPGAATAALLQGLTDHQRAAVTHGEGPLMVFAGPGSGKTTVLTRRIAWLIATGLAAPSEILAVTFTVRAASEMRLRLAGLLDDATLAGLTVATYHSTCVRLLRANAHALRRTPGFTIYDEADMLGLLEELAEHGPSPALRAALGDADRTAMRAVLREVSLDKLSLRRSVAVAGEAAAALESALSNVNAFGFDDLLVHSAWLLHAHAAVTAAARARWRWVLVDEYQDSNPVQAELVHTLVGDGGNVTVVADDDQAIYRFAGAESGNVLRFAERQPGCRTIVLGWNFRCRTEIVERSVALIANNTVRQPKELAAARGPGGGVFTRAHANETAEARAVVELVAEAIQQGTDPREVLVVARTARAMRPTIAALAAAGIPHRVLGELGLYARAEVRDALAYLALLVNPYDQAAFTRASSRPRRGIGPATRRALFERARTGGLDLIASAAADHRVRVREFGGQLSVLRDEMLVGRSVGHLAVSAVMLSGGLVEHHQRRRDRARGHEQRRDAERALEDLRGLCRAASEHDRRVDEDLAGFLQEAALIGGEETTAGEDRRLTVSTIHRAKGTEADIVCVVGCETGLLPHWRSTNEVADSDEAARAFEEERRLMYVALTRAREQLHVSWAQQRDGHDGRAPSPFLAEAGLSPAPTGRGSTPTNPTNNEGEADGTTPQPAA